MSEEGRKSFLNFFTSFVNDDGTSYGVSRSLSVLVLQVSFAVCLRRETVTAKLAFERLLASVSSHMSRQGALVVA